MLKFYLKRFSVNVRNYIFILFLDKGKQFRIRLGRNNKF